jgi:membrane protein implicated in regulation of membrane protease activity
LGAFVTGAYAVVLAIATVIPFVAAAAIVVAAALWIRRMLNRSATTASRQV